MTYSLRFVRPQRCALVYIVLSVIGSVLRLWLCSLHLSPQSFPLPVRRYFAQFTKATACSTRVNISLSDNVPAVVEYRLSPPGEKDEDEADDDAAGEDLGFVRYYLAPKIEDDAEQRAQSSYSWPFTSQLRRLLHLHREPFSITCSSSHHLFCFYSLTPFHFMCYPCACAHCFHL